MTIEKGDRVQLEGKGSEGKVLSINGKKAEVAFGQIKMQVLIKKLTRIGKGNSQLIGKSNRGSLGATKGVGGAMHRKALEFKPFLDMRGLKVEEAMQVVERFVDEAIMSGGKDIQILHGKGNGVLRNIVRKVLRDYKQVSNIRDAHVDNGGAGITEFDME